ncbi:MAG: MBL fold metallo-hydrolase, partial [Lysinibacillus sp.]
LFPVNCYLIEEEQELTLIDAAMPYSAKGIIRASQEIGKPITRLILTHAHSDHVGALDAIKKLLPDIEVSISSRDASLLAGDTTLLEGEPTTPIRGGVPKNILTKPDRLLVEGDCIGSLEVIASPGHTPGSIALFDKRSAGLIVGDAFQTRGKVAVSGLVVPSFPFPALATWNKEKAIDSAKKLVALQPKVLAAGHGKMLEEPVHAMKQAIDEAEKYLK